MCTVDSGCLLIDPTRTECRRTCTPREESNVTLPYATMRLRARPRGNCMVMYGDDQSGKTEGQEGVEWSLAWHVAARQGQGRGSRYYRPSFVANMIAVDSTPRVI